MSTTYVVSTELLHFNTTRSFKTSWDVAAYVGEELQRSKQSWRSITITRPGKSTGSSAQDVIVNS